MPDKFILFGVQHFAVMGLTFGAPLLLALPVRRLRHDRLDLHIRRGFAALLIGTWIAWYALFIARGWLGLGNALPMNLCDWATVAALLACLRRNQKAYELAYFWGLAGTIQGIVTPDVNYGFPEAQFLVFIAGHALIIGAVLYLTFAGGLRPVASSLKRVALWTLGYAAAAGVTDWLLGVNYGFFRAKPAHATLFDLFHAWPYYLPEMIAFGMAAMALLYAPWWASDRLGKRRAAIA